MRAAFLALALRFNAIGWRAREALSTGLHAMVYGKIASDYEQRAVFAELPGAHTLI